jgi:hypothetical protein
MNRTPIRNMSCLRNRPEGLFILVVMVTPFGVAGRWGHSYVDFLSKLVGCMIFAVPVWVASVVIVGWLIERDRTDGAAPPTDNGRQ